MPRERHSAKGDRVVGALYFWVHEGFPDVGGWAHAEETEGTITTEAPVVILHEVNSVELNPLPVEAAEAEFGLAFHVPQKQSLDSSHAAEGCLRECSNHFLWWQRSTVEAEGGVHWLIGEGAGWELGERSCLAVERPGNSMGGREVEVECSNLLGRNYGLILVKKQKLALTNKK